MEARGVTSGPPGEGPAAAFDAVILAGGRGSRLGGVSKGDLEVGGRRLVDIAVGAARDAGASRVIVVGSVAVDAPAVVVSEDPPFGGPAAGLAAALPTVTAPWTLLLACDLPRAAELVDLLVRELLDLGVDPPISTHVDPPAGADGDDQVLRRAPAAGLGDGLVVVDGEGHTQWLAGLYRTASLRHAVEAASEAQRGNGDSKSKGSDSDANGNGNGNGESDLNPGLAGLPIRRILQPLRLAHVQDTVGASTDIDTPEQLAAARASVHQPAPQHSPAQGRETRR